MAMFDLADKGQENLRREWYSPIGEYVLLFSNLEFELSSWIHLLSDSRALRDVASTLKFSPKLDLLPGLIDEYQVSLETKEKWKREWQQAKPLANTRNLICHNPPIDHFSLSLGDQGKVSLGSRMIEVHALKKPIGEPGSGLALDDLKQKTDSLRQLLIRLDLMHTEEIVRYG